MHLTSQVLIKLKNKIEEIIDNNSSIIFGYFSNLELVGSIIVGNENNQIVIEYIGVREDCRKRNIGYTLIEYVMKEYKLQCVTETDSSAVVFYEKSGFECNEISKEYNGEKVTRFTCIKNRL
jgi:ribosomal protein S18 acetylase RimI-like enzyme